MSDFGLRFGKFASCFKRKVNRDHYIIEYLRKYQNKNKNNGTYFNNIEAKDLRPGYLVTDPEHLLNLVLNNTQPEEEESRKEYAVPFRKLFPDEEQFRKRAYWNIFNNFDGKSHLEQIPGDSYYQNHQLQILEAHVDWQLHYHNKMEEFYQSNYPKKLFEPQTKKEYELLTNYDLYLPDIVKMEPLKGNDTRGTYIEAYSTASQFYCAQLKKKPIYNGKPIPSMEIFNCQRIKKLKDGIYLLINQVNVAPNKKNVQSFGFDLVYVYQGYTYLHSCIYDLGIGTYSGSPSKHIKNFLKRKR